MKIKQAAIFLVFFLFSICAHCWGFFAHKRINRLAVFTLPPEMILFYKHHIVYLTENAINPDQRRYALEGEAPRHYIDIDAYGDSAVFKMPRYWDQALLKFSEDTLIAHGINPWFVNKMKMQLTNAFRKGDAKAILRLSADLGHYISDGNVPLHTTHNYNGQFTNQHGIHGFWESRLPELYSEDYNYFVGKAEYIKNTQLQAWNSIVSAHLALDSVFSFEKHLTENFSEDKKYSFEERNGLTVKVYSKAFSNAYHKMLSGQVERRMLASIKMTGDFWFTCWVDAGQPDLSKLLEFKFTEEEKKEMEEEHMDRKRNNLNVREEACNIKRHDDNDLFDCCPHRVEHISANKFPIIK